MALLNSLAILCLGIVVLCTKDGTWWGVLGILTILTGTLGVAECYELYDYL